MLVKMPPSKTDTYRVILLKNRMVRPKDSLSNANPLTQKQKNKTQTLIKKTKPLIHQKKKKKKKKANPKTQTVFPDQDSYSL